MNNKVSLTDQWKAEFIYGKEYGELCSKGVDFYLFLEENNNEFFGKVFDMEAPLDEKDVPLVRGFIKDSYISFTKQYINNFLIDENGSYS